jgi:hypothetical protein
MPRLTDAELDDLKARNPVNELAGVRLRRGSSAFGRAGFTGPCPICSNDAQKRTAQRFECNAERWVCAVCQDGGDILKLLMKRDGIDFKEAVTRLGGVAPVAMTPIVADRAGKAAFARGVPVSAAIDFSVHAALICAWQDGWQKAKRADDSNNAYRERERKRLFDWWEVAAPIYDKTAANGLSPRNPVVAYLAGRGLIAPPNARLRFHPRIPLFADGREQEPRMLHQGPAMLAAILAPNFGSAGFHFAGLHMTWLDPAGPKGKLSIADPETRESVPSKKVRGSKAGGYIDLGGDRYDQFDNDRPVYARMFAGEGIETTLVPYTALMRTRRLRAGDGFRCGIDLGNLAGKATFTIAHPTEKTERGIPRRVGGPEPDLDAPAMPVPESVSELVGLGDGDSDPFLTQYAMARFKARNTTPDRTVRVVFAPPGGDFNDSLQGKEKIA